MLNPSAHAITLIRHGPPTVSMRTPLQGKEFRRFIERYEAANIKRQAMPPLAVKQIMHQADLVFSSHRPRAMHTAELLGSPMPPIIDERFREIEFPVDFPTHFRLTAITWTVLAVLLWRLGYSPDCEPNPAAKQRARLMAALLASKAEQTGHIILVAHGGINRLIAKELRRLGWTGPRLPRSGHWGCTTYLCQRSTTVAIR